MVEVALEHGKEAEQHGDGRRCKGWEGEEAGKVEKMKEWSWR